MSNRLLSMECFSRIIEFSYIKTATFADIKKISPYVLNKVIIYVSFKKIYTHIVAVHSIFYTKQTYQRSPVLALFR